MRDETLMVTDGEIESWVIQGLVDHLLYRKHQKELDAMYKEAHTMIKGISPVALRQIVMVKVQREMTGNRADIIGLVERARGEVVQGEGRKKV